MKKFLFTLAALLMAGSLCADEYFYMEDFELTQEFVNQTSNKQRRMQIPVKAHFDHYVSAWQVDLTLPEGVTLYDAVKGADMTIPYMGRSGNDMESVVALSMSLENCRFIAASTEAGYWYAPGMDPDEDDPVSYGAVKWLGDYNEMFIVTLQFPQGFEGGDIIVKTAPSSSADTRGEICPLGQVYERVCHVTVEGGQQPIEKTDAPVITVVDDPEAQTVTVTATGNGHICLYWDDMLQAEGEGTAEWVIPYGEDPEGEEYGVSATAQEEGKEVSDYTLETVFVPGIPAGPAVTPTPEIVITPDADNMGYTIEVVGEGELHLYINGEEVENPYHIDRTDEAQTLVITATAQVEDMEISAAAEKTFVVPAFTGEGIYIVLIDQEGNEVQYDLYASANNPNNYVTMVTLEYNPWGAFDPYYEERPNVPFYFIVNGERLGAENDMTPTAMGDIEQTLRNPLFATDFCYTVPVGYTYTIGIQFTADGDMYVLCAQGPRVGVDELNADKAVAGVRYFNMAGQEMQEVNGATIVVTTYTDGTTSAVKVIK